MCRSRRCPDDFYLDNYQAEFRIRAASIIERTVKIQEGFRAAVRQPPLSEAKKGTVVKIRATLGVGGGAVSRTPSLDPQG
jgi:hypothetical protein